MNSRWRLMMKKLQTRDSKLAAYLVTRGHQITSTQRSGGVVHFSFPESPELRDDAERFRLGLDDEVSARRPFEAEARVRDLIFGRQLR